MVDEVLAFDAGLDVLVVDDHSSDATAVIARSHGARVLSLPFNLGIGGAVQAGFRYAELHDYDVAVRVDGDGQHDPGELRRRRRRHPGVADISVGSRFAGADGYRSSRPAASGSASSRACVAAHRAAAH